MNALHGTTLTISSNDLARPPRRCHGFTITELMVVIGIIVLLAGLLLAALGGVRNRAMATRTVSIMQGFSAACDAFQTDHGHYPGVIPEEWLAQASSGQNGGEVTVVGGGGGERPTSFTSTENALLHLMGGYRVLSPADGALDEVHPVRVAFNNFVADYEFVFRRDSTGGADDVWRLKVSLRRIGEGPVINGKAYAPYYTPGSGDVGVAPGQVGATDSEGAGDWVRIPDLLDGWGQPILYLRQLRTRGPLIGPSFPGSAEDRPQFMMNGLTGYLESNELGESGQDQVYSNNYRSGSILTITPPTDGDRLANLAQIIRHPAFGTYVESPLSEDNRRTVTARGAYALISAGPDGIYFSATDGPGANDAVVTDLSTGEFANPRAIDSYDDVRVFGGG